MAPEARGPRRWTLCFVSALHALAFAGIALALPFASYPLFASLTALLALAHTGLSLGAALAHREVDRAFRAVALLSLGWLLIVSLGFLGSGLYVARVFGALGTGIALAIAIAWAIPVLVTVPFAAWGWSVTPPLFRSRSRAERIAVAALLLAALVLVARFAYGIQGAAAQRVNGLPSDAELERSIAERLPRWTDLPESTAPSPRLELSRTKCSEPPALDRIVLFVQYVTASRGKPQRRQRCIVEPDWPSAVSELSRLVQAEAVREPVRIDVPTALQPLSSTDALLDAFTLRPGLDGICDAQRCLLGWQLLARRLVAEHAPLPSLPEMRMGFSVANLRRALGAEEANLLDGLTRIVTKSFLYDGKLTPLLRLRPQTVALTPEAFERADRAAQAHIEAALLENGRYRYQLEPFSGRIDDVGFLLQRQAGTTLAVCELAEAERVRRVAGPALAAMAKLERRDASGSVLSHPVQKRVAPLGELALPLAAFLSCRPLVGNEHDALISGLVTRLLDLQRDDGSFARGWDTQRQRPAGGVPSLFDPGQTVLALVLSLDAARSAAGLDLPDTERLRDAVQRAMTHYGERYWDHPLGPLFYVEENWHCLAARAALAVHRHDGYERFCLAYAEFRERFILGEDVPTRDLVGAFALGPVIPPPNTATAGVGEVVAAAIAVRRARKESTEADERVLEHLLEFLLRQQWDATQARASARAKLVEGGFSDSILVPTMRIDFTQHAWSALRYGAHVLGLGPAARAP